jgi:ubiquinone/menaquinone biosynthesis C-methylase UbiE
MKTNTEKIRHLVQGMRLAYSRGENAMAWARANSECLDNAIDAALIAYDLQAGSYVAHARENQDYRKRWCAQLASLINPWAEAGDRILEVGVGEATTLSGVVAELPHLALRSFGFDISWSRIKVGREWAMENNLALQLFVADLFHIPMADDAVDVVYTSHSLEPNGGRETAAIKECLRVARKAVVLVEPLFELASNAAQARMTAHGYVKNLKNTAESLGANVVEYGLLDICANPLNPSGIVLLAKGGSRPRPADNSTSWQCPISGTRLVDAGDLFYASDVGISYPVMREIPLLRPEHAVIASSLRVTPAS